MAKRPHEFPCAECPALGKVFKLDTINDHYRHYHAGISYFKCGECGLVFSHKTSMVRHIKSDHENTANVYENVLSSGSVGSLGPVGESWDNLSENPSESQDSDSDVCNVDETLVHTLDEDFDPYPVLD
ncbi:Zinc finger protein 69-like protein B [Frankliniella fusca]|uniref:Zinc finger protein 69-like protein B n=1 Tax=Frankliniella fusca TaxID=407009 RepID=A0AAE1LRD6_9NEOP|nr:Zinc finger protein 69-like protein B [Frankliniella fusca]